MSDFLYIDSNTKSYVEKTSQANISKGLYNTYNINNSCIFNASSDQYLSRTFNSTPSTYTISCWIKKTVNSSQQTICASRSGASYPGALYFNSSDQLILQTGPSSSTIFTTTRVFRDTSAWYHIVLSVEASKPSYLYVNGEAVESFTAASTPWIFVSSYTNTIGRYGDTALYQWNGYMAEFYYIDGQALTPFNFGYFDNQRDFVWKPRRYTGSFTGSDSFYLNFSSSSSIGLDSSGRNNNFTTFGGMTVGNNILNDSPTNNYCIINILSPSISSYVSSGNLITSSPYAYELRGTIAVSSGKWYWEVSPSTNGSSLTIGISGYTAAATYPFYPGSGAQSYAYGGSDGYKYLDGSGSAYGSTFTSGDIIGVALDLDNLKIWFSKNGVWQNSGDPIIGTNQAFNLVQRSYSPAVGRYINTAGSSNCSLNFGQRAFSSPPPTGFRSLCSANLPVPLIKKPNQYMDVVTYTGNGSTQTISGLGFSPDLVWIKSRSSAGTHVLTDIVRGTGKQLFSSSTNPEGSETDQITAFNSNGFSLGANTGGTGSTNQNTTTYVAWAWDETPIAGMDIVSYTGNGTNRTIAHNLGVAPKMMIVKNRSFVGSTNWCVYHSSLSSPANSVFLDTTDAQASYPNVWNSTAPTSSVFSVGTNLSSNGNGNNMIAYLFAEVEGFSKFGSYTGNGSADGAFVYCGFRPAFIMVKGSSFVSNWFINDNKRPNRNVITLTALRANLSNAESNVTTYDMDFTSNGFKIRTSEGDSNTSSATFIFAAFAETPFKYSLAR